MSFARFFDVDAEGAARHAIHLLETQKETGISAVRHGMEVIRFATGRNYAGVFAALNAATADASTIIAAVKAEFGLD